MYQIASGYIFGQRLGRNLIKHNKCLWRNRSLIPVNTFHRRFHREVAGEYRQRRLSLWWLEICMKAIGRAWRGQKQNSQIPRACPNWLLPIEHAEAARVFNPAAQKVFTVSTYSGSDRMWNMITGGVLVLGCKILFYIVIELLHLSGVKCHFSLIGDLHLDV